MEGHSGRREGVLGELSLEVEETNLIQNCKRGANTASYEASKESKVTLFFELIRQYGGKKLQYLLHSELNQYDSKGRMDFKFYNIVGGEKHPAKQSILNLCLTLFIVKSSISRGPDKGKPHQPNSMKQYIKKINYVFREKGILYDLEKDFNAKQDYHGVLIDRWQKQRDIDPTLDVNPTKRSL